MARYLFRRVLFFVFVLFVISIASFLIMFKLGPERFRFPAQRCAGCGYAIVDRFGLEGPIWIQYLRWAKGFVPWPGWFLNEQYYFSFSNFVPVRDEIASRLPVDAAVALGSVAMWVLVAVPIGVLSAVRRRMRTSRVASMAGALALSVPVFLLAAALQYVIGFRLRLLPIGGLPGELRPVVAGSARVVGSRVHHGTLWAVLHGYFLLPWIALALAGAVAYVRRSRAETRRALAQRNVDVERALGLRERRVVRHAVRVALGPIVGALGRDMWLLVGGLVVVETAFKLPGVGQYLMGSFFTNDQPGVMGVIATFSVVAIGANLIFEAVRGWLDPRIRYAPGAASAPAGV
jgi:peptide/nickel transport system permease protein